MHNNHEMRRFELEAEGGITFADYRKEGSTLHILHVETPPQLRGKGYAGQLMQEILDWARAQEFEINPVCGYAAVWLKRNA